MAQPPRLESTPNAATSWRATVQTVAGSAGSIVHSEWLHLELHSSDFAAWRSADRVILAQFRREGMAEWSMAVVLKTPELAVSSRATRRGCAPGGWRKP